jgi:hypothetical protein
MKTTNCLFAFPLTLISLSACQIAFADEQNTNISLAPITIKGDVLGTASDPEVRTYSGSRSVIDAADLRKGSVRGIDDALQRVPVPAPCRRFLSEVYTRAAADVFKPCPMASRWPWRLMVRPVYRCFQ